jgi:ubiquinone/menaquinone biosynthesis C-methylase UbiE
MKRVLEPELMEDEEQARAYAYADFEAAHSGFISCFQNTFKGRSVGRFVLDLGCGPADISIRFARAHPACIVHGVDGSKAMLRYGNERLSKETDIRDRVELVYGMLPGASLPRTEYDAVISNSLLHHLPEPKILWTSVRAYAAPGSMVFIMDLVRPPSVEEATALVEAYAGAEPEVHQRDFYNSLLAAFEIGEIRDQLLDAGLDRFSVEQISDRHVVIAGDAP